MMDYELKDSGKRESYDTGAVRDTAEGKGRYDLLSSRAIRRLAVILEKGAIKYSSRNWEKGIPLRRFIDSGLRHIFQLLEGDTAEDHAAQAMWNMMAFMDTAERIKSGDLPQSLGEDVPESLWKATGPLLNPDPYVPGSYRYRHRTIVYTEAELNRILDEYQEDETGPQKKIKKDLTSKNDEPTIESVSSDSRFVMMSDEDFLKSKRSGRLPDAKYKAYQGKIDPPPNSSVL